MLRLSPSQWQGLRQDEAQRFVAAVADQLVAGRPELHGQRPAMLTQLHAMHHLAAQVGLTSTAQIIRLMHLAADAPDLHKDPALRAWLMRPGQSPEQRLDDLLTLIDYRLLGPD